MKFSMKIFKLPDLGEGLQEAEIVQVARQGRRRGEDRPADGVGRDREGDRRHPGAVRRQGRASSTATRATSRTSARRSSAFEGESEDADAGTVVGKVEVGQKVVARSAAGAAPAPSPRGIKATPAVRVLARKLNVDLAMVTPTGADGMITPSDVQRAARILSETGPIELLRGVRRAMAQNMMLANAEVASATIMDDADIEAWPAGTSTSCCGSSARSSPAAAPSLR